MSAVNPIVHGGGGKFTPYRFYWNIYGLVVLKFFFFKCDLFM